MGNSDSDAISFRSPDGQYRLRLLDSPVRKILSLGQEAAPAETGGILVGQYVNSNRVAEVSKVIGPPPDSTGGRYWFERGKRGLSERLNALWDDGVYYLGEWHTHPDKSPRPSVTDRTHMCKIQRSESYDCAVPVLIVVGGRIMRRDISAFTFPQDRLMVEMTRSTLTE
ncbi:hypothetical protein BSZ35_00095 [Salinibacter sp. 10B]|nr:hypothetical protein BSZ35_00095 [Salinibacter sp. 10B]